MLSPISLINCVALVVALCTTFGGHQWIAAAQQLPAPQVSQTAALLPCSPPDIVESCTWTQQAAISGPATVAGVWPPAGGQLPVVQLQGAAAAAAGATATQGKCGRSCRMLEQLNYWLPCLPWIISGSQMKRCRTCLTCRDGQQRQHNTAHSRPLDLLKQQPHASLQHM